MGGRRAKDGGAKEDPPLVKLSTPSSFSEERGGERTAEPPATGARVAAAAGAAPGAATIAYGASEGGGEENEEEEEEEGVAPLPPWSAAAGAGVGRGVAAPTETEWLAEEEPSSTADSSADSVAASSASPPPYPLSLTSTELLPELAPEPLNGAGVAPAASSPVPLPLPEAMPMGSVGEELGTGSPPSQRALSSIAAKSSVVSPAAAAAKEALDGSLDLASSQTLSEVPARTTEPSLVAVAAVTQSLPGVPSCNGTRACWIEWDDKRNNKVRPVDCGRDSSNNTIGIVR